MVRARSRLSSGRPLHPSGPTYLAHLRRPRRGASRVALWSPPSKFARRHLAPYLTIRRGAPRAPERGPTGASRSRIDVPRAVGAVAARSERRAAQPAALGKPGRGEGKLRMAGPVRVPSLDDMPTIVIAGGGIAGLEALISLHRHVRDPGSEIELLEADADLVERHTRCRSPCRRRPCAALRSRPF